jgi:hypothetical protein
VECEQSCGSFWSQLITFEQGGGGRQNGSTTSISFSGFPASAPQQSERLPQAAPELDDQFDLHP